MRMINLFAATVYSLYRLRENGKYQVDVVGFLQSRRHIPRFIIDSHNADDQPVRGHRLLTLPFKRER